MNTRRRGLFVYLCPANCTCAIYLNSGISSDCSYIVKAIQTQIQSISSHLIPPLIDYSKWPLLSRTVRSSRSTTEDSGFPLSNIFTWGFSSVAKEMRHRRSCWMCYGKISVWRWVGGGGGVKLVLRFPMEEGIVEYQWSFPEVSPILNLTVKPREGIR